MSSRNPSDPFPNLESKLQNPARKSAFERQKAEAEAKRRREAAETAAALEDFVKSFEDDDAGGSRPGYSSRGGMGVGGGPGAGFGARGGRPGGPGKRHFVQTGMKSGPGSLGPAPGGFVKKRAFDTFRSDSGRGGDRGTLSYEDQEFSGQASKGIARAFRASDDEDEAEGPAREEEMIARPTLQLAQLPPGMSLAAMKALVPGNLTVESVKIVPGPPRAHGERKSTVAIVTLSQDTPANEIDVAVSQLQNRYLGFGFYLSIHRHLSSAVSSSVTTSQVSASSSSAQPFGAKPVAQGSASQQGGGGGFHRGFAPPTSYGPPSTIQRSSLMHVPVQPPQDIKTVQMVSMVIEGLLEHGPEFEALLMTRPDVQKEEKWAWIWNPRSEAGVWYRWKLWQVVTGAPSSRGREKYHPIFEDSHAWKEPTKGLPFEYVAELDELVSDPDYNSSDDEEWEGDGNKDNTAAKEVDKTFLNPLEKARLTHLLSRLPTTLSHIKKGDIARVTAFAITHASRGADEVVDLIVSNIDKPLALSGANPRRRQAGKDRDSSPEPEEGNKAGSDGSDMSGVNLVGLYVINDILSSSSTSVVRHAWRFRQLFEAALKERRTFEKLGMMAHKHGWGRLRAEKWKRSVGLILNLWEGWCVFPAESQELFVRSFDDPPELRAARKAEEVSEEKKGRWKPVEATAAEGQAREDRGEPMSEDDVVGEALQEEDVEGEPMSDGDAEGEPMEEDDDPVGEPMDESDAEGVPMEESEPEGEPMEESDAEGGGVGAGVGASAGDETPAPAPAPASIDEGKQAGAGPVAFSSARKGQPRSRMRAVDMFADSDDEGEGRR